MQLETACHALFQTLKSALVRLAALPSGWLLAEIEMQSRPLERLRTSERDRATQRVVGETLRELSLLQTLEPSKAPEKEKRGGHVLKN